MLTLDTCSHVKISNLTTKKWTCSLLPKGKLNYGNKNAVPRRDVSLVVESPIHGVHVTTASQSILSLFCLLVRPKHRTCPLPRISYHVV